MNFDARTSLNCWKKDNFIISTDNEKINIATVYEFLKTTYWAKSRTLQQVENSIKNSLCFGMYENNNQIGFARIITDYTTFAYLVDVFILPSYQKLGLGKWLIDTIFNTEELKNIISWLLLTNDAHKLYERVGFIEFPHPERVMMKNESLHRKHTENNLVASENFEKV